MGSLIDARQEQDRLAAASASYAEQLDAENVVSALLCQPLDRPTYERECGRINIQPWEDARICQAQYALIYGDMPSEISRWAEYGLARMRLTGLRAERRAQSAPAPVAQATCASCGASVAVSQLLSASRGPGCPDCYDRASN